MNQPIELTASNPFVTNLVSHSPFRGALVLFALGCFWLCPIAQAVSPAPDGAYPAGNTAEGNQALFSLTSGAWNTALGNQTLYHDTSGGSNIAVGVRALFSNTTGHRNTATGVYALYGNTTGRENTADGYQALSNNSTGFFNTATGVQALFSNNANGNTADGYQALLSNTTGVRNNAVGHQALLSNVTASFNNAVGTTSLYSNRGTGNDAFGDAALQDNVNGNFNTAIGDLAGSDITGSGNVCVGAGVLGSASENNVTRIKNIGATAQNSGIYVTLDAVNGTKLGYVNISSSLRYKEDIKPMNKASEALFALKPVNFRYKKEFDADRAERFGLVAEEVEKVNPDLVARNDRGELTTVRYEAVNAMLLNEFLKEHRKVQELEAALKTINKRLKEQDAKIDKVDAKVELTRSVPQMAENNQ
jgi:hypothetical protein